MLQCCAAHCVSKLSRSPAACLPRAILSNPLAQPALQYHHLQHPYAAISNAINTSASPCAPSSPAPLLCISTNSSLPSILQHHLPLPFINIPLRWKSIGPPSAGEHEHAASLQHPGGVSARSQSRVPRRNNKRPWQGKSQQQGLAVGHKRNRESMPLSNDNSSRSSSSSSSRSSSSSSDRNSSRSSSSSSSDRNSSRSSSSDRNSSRSSSSSNRNNNKRPKTEGGAPRAKSSQTPSLHECMQDATAGSTPQQSFEALYNLGKRVQKDDSDEKRYAKEEREGIVVAAHVLVAQMLGLQIPTSLGSSSTTTTTTTTAATTTNVASSAINSHVSLLAPVLQLNSKELSLSVWAFSQLVSADSRVRSRRLRELVDAIAAHAVGSSVMKETTDDACMHWSRLLYGVAKMGLSCRDSNAVHQLFKAGAELLPQMLHRKQPCEPQNVSNPLWAFASAEYRGSLQQLVSELASNLGWVMKDAEPQGWSMAVWALATLRSQKVMLGEQSAVIKIVSAGVEGVVQQRWEAAPQNLSNTLWALATLDHNPGNATINTLATAMAESSNTATPQNLSNALQALGTLRWYQPEVYSKLVERLLHSISSSTPDAVGQDFSNALFSCALACHFDSSVDALAAWGSQQDLQQWTEQAISNTLFSWAILVATAGGDTAHMRTLAQHMFKEANRRGTARFTAENDLCKLYGAHLEALHLGLPGGGLTDSTLLQAAHKHTAERRQEIRMQESHNANTVAIALQGHFEVQAAMVHGYYTLLVTHNSHRIAIEVTQRYRDYLNHPSGQLYGKTALRLKHVERGCDGLVLCDESELRKSSIEQQREMLVQCIEQVLGDQKQVSRLQGG